MFSEPLIYLITGVLVSSKSGQTEVSPGQKDSEAIYLSLGTEGLF